MRCPGYRDAPSSALQGGAAAPAQGGETVTNVSHKSVLEEGVAFPSTGLSPFFAARQGSLLYKHQEKLVPERLAGSTFPSGFKRAVSMSLPPSLIPPTKNPPTHSICLCHRDRVIYPSVLKLGDGEGEEIM